MTVIMSMEKHAHCIGSSSAGGPLQDGNNVTTVVKGPKHLPPPPSHHLPNTTTPSFMIRDLIRDPIASRVGDPRASPQSPLELSMKHETTSDSEYNEDDSDCAPDGKYIVIINDKSKWRFNSFSLHSFT